MRHTSPFPQNNLFIQLKMASCLRHKTSAVASSFNYSRYNIRTLTTIPQVSQKHYTRAITSHTRNSRTQLNITNHTSPALYHIKRTMSSQQSHSLHRNSLFDLSGKVALVSGKWVAAIIAPGLTIPRRW
jgi:hypothetical protein